MFISKQKYRKKSPTSFEKWVNSFLFPLSILTSSWCCRAWGRPVWSTWCTAPWSDSPTSTGSSSCRARSSPPGPGSTTRLTGRWDWPWPWAVPSLLTCTPTTPTSETASGEHFSRGGRQSLSPTQKLGWVQPSSLWVFLVLYKLSLVISENGRTFFSST